MREESTPSPQPSRAPRVAPPVGTCEHCDITFVPKRQTRGRFCSAECYRAWWNAHGQREYAKRGLKRLEELREAGRDPRSTEQAAWKRKMAFRATALSGSPEEEVTDDLAWAERGAYWQDLADPPKPEVFFRKPRQRHPLVLTGHGVRLRIDKGTLLVRHGFTHYPQQASEERFFPGDSRLPSRIILVDSDGYLTSDVAAWLSRQAIPLVVLDWRGRVVSVLGSETRSPDPGLREAQIAAQTNGAGLRIATWLIAEKLRASVQTLRTLEPSDRIEVAARELESMVQGLEEEPPADIERLLLLEARGALYYFGAWQGLPVHWKGTGRRPIPPEWRRMPIRQSLVGYSNRHSSHPISSMQNYGYSALESEVRAALAIEALDDDVSFLHAGRPGRAALVFDAMEPLRPLADVGVLGLVSSRTLAPADFHITDKGVCRLHPQLAHTILALQSLEAAAHDVGDWLRSRLELTSSLGGPLSDSRTS